MILSGFECDDSRRQITGYGVGQPSVWLAEKQAAAAALPDQCLDCLQQSSERCAQRFPGSYPSQGGTLDIEQTQRLAFDGGGLQISNLPIDNRAGTPPVFVS